MKKNTRIVEKRFEVAVVEIVADGAGNQAQSMRYYQ
jgi:hypothetical protein